MADLKVALEEALSGQGRLVMLVGEPGIGKTRTAQELAAQAETLGAQVLWGWCYEEEGAPPYWPWVQPIRSYIQQADPEQLASEMGQGAADIAELVPQIREKLPDLEAPRALEPDQARFRLFDSITQFLKNSAQSRPMVLILDDLHWADRSSLLLLQFLAREMGESRLLVVGTYRDVELSLQHPLSETLAQLTRHPVFRRELLRGLTQEDTGQFIESVARVRSSPTLIENIFAHTEGNPFFMTEVLRLLTEQGDLTSDEIGGSTGFIIPEGVRDVVGQRVNRLSSGCNEVLTTASIIGREFEFKLLAMLSDGISEDLLVQMIDEAVDAHLLEEVAGSWEEYRFSHALVQETLSEGLSTRGKVRLHARIGGALESLYGADVQAHADELAYHFGAAKPMLGPEKLVHYSLLAGERALAAYGYEEARSHFQRALAAKGWDPSSADPGQEVDAENAALLFGLSRAQLATLQRHQTQEALANLSSAFDYYVRAGDVAQAVAVAVYPYDPPVGHHMGAAHLIDRALALVPSDSHEAGRLFSRYGIVIGMEEVDYNRALEAFDRALVIARSLNDVALEVWPLALSARVDRFHLRYEECLEKSLSAIELARRTNTPYAEAVGHRWAARVLEVTGDLEGALLHAAAALDLAEKLRDRARLTSALDINANLHRLMGDWEAAHDFSTRGLEVAPKPKLR